MEEEMFFDFANQNSTANGPAYAAAVSIEIVLAAITNLFVLIFTICHPKTLKQPSIIFLTNFILANLVMTFIYMPTIVITAIESEWIFGQKIEQKMGTCQFIAFVFTHIIYTQTFTLTAISVDRFLFIVKPLIHRQYMKTWVAVLVSIFTWLASCIISIPPLLGFGLYESSIYNFTCIPVWHADGIYVALASVILGSCVVVIIVTSIRTYRFTHNYIKMKVHPAGTTNTSNVSNTGNVYDSRLVKIMGIFGTMLLVTAITYAPAFIGLIVGAIFRYERVPGEVYSTITFLFYTITISNPMIQSYFRKDLKDFIVSSVKKFFSCSSDRRSRESSAIIMVQQQSQQANVQ